MKRRVIAFILILTLLLVPSITGAFAEPDQNQESEAQTAESTAVAETEAPDSEVTEPVVTDTPEPAETTELSLPEETDPAETEPIETEPVDTESEETEPEATEPAETEPVATEPAETEPETTEPVDSSDPTEPDSTEPSAVPTEPQEFSEFAPDLDPTESDPGREISHGLVDPSEVRYQYYWVLRLHSMDDASVSVVKAYIRSNDGTTVFSVERSDENEGHITKPADPKRDNYEFLGWFTDEKFTNDKEFHFTDDTVITSNLDLYAKWNELQGTITIRRKLNQDETQSFWFTVEGDDGSKINVAIPKGKESVTIVGVKYGVTYTITEQSDWSWRFVSNKPVQKVTLSDSNISETVSFEGQLSVTKWLSAISQLIKIVKEG